MRSKFSHSLTQTDDDIKVSALADEKALRIVEGKTIRKVIVNNIGEHRYLMIGKAAPPQENLYMGVGHLDSVGRNFTGVDIGWPVAGFLRGLTDFVSGTNQSHFRISADSPGFLQ